MCKVCHKWATIDFYSEQHLFILEKFVGRERERERVEKGRKSVKVLIALIIGLKWQIFKYYLYYTYNSVGIAVKMLKYYMTFELVGN